MEFIHKESLRKAVEDGLVSVQKHITEDLYIYNYTQKVQYEKLWDDITMQTRGLILDGEGRIVARPFKKFFNIEEYEGNLPSLDFVAYDKMDGSLGIVFYYNNRWHIATKGSFTSDQAIRGRELLERYDIGKLDINYTYLFEIIY